MASVLSHTPVPALDSRRIAANSLTIALHVAVLMLLLAPTSAPPTPAGRERLTVVDFAQKREVPPMPPPPPPTKPRTERTPTPAIVPIAAEPVTDTPAPIDEGLPAAIDNPPDATTFGDVSAAFVQLQTAVAPPPPYPPMALRRGIEGTVLLRVRVDRDGRPSDVAIERSSGSHLLDEAARKFLQARWRFVPATMGGSAIEAYALVPVNFSIER